MAASQPSLPSEPRRRERNRTNWLQRLQPISRLCCYSGERNAFSKDLQTLPEGKGLIPALERSLNGCNEDWDSKTTESWGRIAARVSFSGPRTSIQPELCFSLAVLGREWEEGEGETEREYYVPMFTEFFIWMLQNVAKLQCGLMGIDS